MSSSRGQALSSIGILDFTTLIPGPFATMVLADLGARVIRIEAPHRSDAVRALAAGPDGAGSTWHRALGRSKRSIQLDLKNPRGREVVFRLLGTHDVVIEQMRPGVMDRLGVGYEALAESCRRVIYCSINSFGSDGPNRDRAAHDINALALAGVLGAGGGWGGNCGAASDIPLGIQVADLGAAMNAVAGILAAVVHRGATGQGQRVEVSLYESALMWNLLGLGECLAGVGNAAPGGGLLNGGSRYGVYETADGRHLALGGLEPAIWERFCIAAGREDLHVSSLSTVEPGLKAELGALVRERTLAEWIELLDDVDACADPVLTVEEAADRMRTTAPRMYVEVGEGSDRQPQVGNAIRLSETPAGYARPGVEPGVDRDQIMAEVGYTSDEIRKFAAAGAFG